MIVRPFGAPFRVRPQEEDPYRVCQNHQFNWWFLLIFLFDAKVIIPGHMAQYEVHEKFGHFLDDLITHGIENRVMIAPCGEDDAREEEQQVQP